MGELDNAYELAAAGDLRTLARWHAQLPPASSWEVAARSLWHLAANNIPSTNVDELTCLDHDAGSLEAAQNIARACVLDLDWSGLRAVTQWLSKGSDERSQLLSMLWTGFESVLCRGELPVEKAQQCYKIAAEHGWAAEAIDATTLGSVALMAKHLNTDALAWARRASRMGQTEHLWLPHYFASIFLTRLRRLTGNSHLASNITTACEQVTCKRWHGWLRWEQLFTGSATVEEVVSERWDPVLSQLSQWLRAPQRGGHRELHALITSSWLHSVDVEIAAPAIDPTVTPSRDIVHQWLTGLRNDAPETLSGLLTRGEGDYGDVLALAHPTAAANRRIIGFALPAHVTRLPAPQKQKMRVQTLVATLVLAGDSGVMRDVLFEQTYGFPYKKDLHEAAFKVLRHHAATYLANVATIQREGGHHLLRTETAFAVVDPRSVRPLKDIMLRCLARSGGASAKEVAESLGVKLRSVQQAIKEMLDEGACVQRRDGRRVAYAVEDTTFLPLTMVD